MASTAQTRLAAAHANADAAVRRAATMTTARPHYHVHAGTVGCLSDACNTFDTKAAAREFMRDEAAIYRECGFAVIGSARRDRYDIEPVNYLEVVPCLDAHCEMLDGDW